jgi:hypothetical protein
MCGVIEGSKFMCGVLEGKEEHMDPQLDHTGTSGPSITSHGNFWILNYTTWELVKPQLIEGSEVPMWCN